MKAYGVIMAGGGGTRFWPLSRKELPKQFLNLTGKDRLVNETFDRLAGVVDAGDIYIVTNELHADLTEELMSGRMARERILAEPAARNTAACIGYAAIEILYKQGDGVMCILPSDHYIRDEKQYRDTLKRAIVLAEQSDKLITIGIKPEYPATGYGYIKNKSTEADYRQVEEFVEKPDWETAEAYLEEGNYAWNSGMFIWKVSTILTYFEKLLPDIYDCLMQIKDAFGTPDEKKVLREIYQVIPKISIDYGIMERAGNVWMLEGNFGWNDVGSLDALEVLHCKDANHNVRLGETVLLDAHNNICYAGDRLLAAIGVDNLIMVETGDIVFVCAKDRAQQVKNIVEQLEAEGKEKYL